jgi:hypothetical protein
MATKIPKRETAAILQSFGAGVVPRIGLQHVAVGRTDEINAMLSDLDKHVAEGGASFRLIVGRYGSGKSFLGQLIRNYALNKNFVVADADLSPTRRLTGSRGEGLGTYRELMKNLATRTVPTGGAYTAILERWISDIQSKVMSEGIEAEDPTFRDTVEQHIRDTVSNMEGMVHVYDFANVINAYWTGYWDGDDVRKEAALRWLRGEYNTKTEAKSALKIVNVIINDETWYDYIKLLARFVQSIGYKGLVIFIDEAVNLYKIANAVARNNNYERLLTIYNDVLQGNAEYLGVVLSGTPQMVDDKTRGLYSYEALRTRLESSRFTNPNLRDLTSPVIRLDMLKPQETYVLLQKLRDIHALHNGYTSTVTDDQVKVFLQEIRRRLGADAFLTPRETVRDFLTVLNLLQQNPNMTFESIVKGITPTTDNSDPEELTPATEIVDESAPNQPAPDEPNSKYSKFDI